MRDLRRVSPSSHQSEEGHHGNSHKKLTIGHSLDHRASLAQRHFYLSLYIRTPPDLTCTASVIHQYQGSCPKRSHVLDLLRAYFGHLPLKFELGTVMGRSNPKHSEGFISDSYQTDSGVPCDWTSLYCFDLVATLSSWKYRPLHIESWTWNMAITDAYQAIYLLMGTLLSTLRLARHINTLSPQKDGQLFGNLEQVCVQKSSLERCILLEVCSYSPPK